MTLLVDVERLLSAFLRAQDELVDLIDTRVYTALPKDPVFPAVRITRIGGVPVTSLPLWLDSANVQVDVFGGAKATTQEIAETIRWLCSERMLGLHDEGVVTKVRAGALRWLPDDTYTPAKNRFLIDMTVFTRPLTVLEGAS